VLDQGNPAHFDFGLTGSPPERFFSATISRIDDTHALITVREVTEQKLVQHQLESLLKSKDDLVASVSHELRTPLTAIVGLATELRFNQAAFGSEEQQEFIRLIADQSSEMADLIDDLLVAARAERGQVVVEPRTIDLSAEVSQVLDVWTGGTAHVDFSTAPNAHADPFRVRQILRNLLSNAARYGTAPVHISVTQTADQQVELLVQDHGAGLSADQWDSIFDPYHRAPDGEKLSGSVGLGLTVSRHLAEVMRGSLDYYVEDGRSTFRLRLPTSPAD
jgi:two-component system sensor histidine kinase ChiS